MRLRLRPGAALAAIALTAVLVSGCNVADDWSRPHAKPSPVGTLGHGFVDPTAPPSPEATVTPKPGSWDAVHPSKGYRVVLLTAGDAPQTACSYSGALKHPRKSQKSLKTVTATAPDQYISQITKAIDLAPDLIINAGNNLIDPLAMVTPNHLDQQFLVVGAELAEPTENVTAADWTGASFRGEGLGMSSSYDPDSFTPERAAAAVRAGVASVLNGLTGIVIWLA